LVNIVQENATCLLIEMVLVIGIVMWQSDQDGYNTYIRCYMN